MTPLIAALLGAMATWFTHHSFARSYAPDAGMEAVTGAFAAVLWGGLAVGSFDLNTYAGGSKSAINADALAYLALVGAVVMLLFTVQAAIGSLRNVDSVSTTEVGR